MEQNIPNPLQSLPVMNIYQTLLTLYGPYAFGTVTVVILWVFMVAPQLEKSAVDFKENALIVKSLEASVSTLQTTSSTNEQTSRALERTAAILETLVSKMNDK